MDETEHNASSPLASWNRLPRTSRVALAVAAAIFIAVLIYVLTAGGQPDPQAESREDAERVVAAVSKLMVLPTDEEPIIATVEDPAQLADQPFFRNAQKGDRVLIYNVARKAILYSPAQNLVVDVAPLSVGTPTPTPAR